MNVLPNVGSSAPSNRAIWRTVLLFALYLVGLFGLLYGLDRQLVDPFTRGIAQLTRVILWLGGIQATVQDKVVGTPAFAVAIQNNCNAIYETALFASAVLAYPATWRQRLSGVLLGGVILYAVNVLRVLSLIYVGSHFRAYFDAAHVYIWQSLFIVFALGLWLYWAGTVARRPQD
ncbi:MAG: exosortase H [Candidatus Methylomirabilota bacterium]|nr:MAG: exosortase H [candidate division NC10 bacterium]